MQTPAISVVDFSDKALKEALAALPPRTPLERMKLLPPVLRAWARKDLREHLSREGRAVVRKRGARLQSIKKQTNDLLLAFSELDELSLFELALRPQLQHQSGDPWKVNVEIASRRRDEAISWLNALVEALNEPQPNPPPDRSTRHYLVIRDMAAIFELISGEAATRRTEFDAGTPYGPFWSFVKALWSAIYGDERGLQNAVKIWAQEAARQTKLVSAELARAAEVLGRSLDPERDRAVVESIVSRCRSCSPFLANLQLRHRSLWRKLKPTT
jgi:hypothetical protein